MLDFITAIKSLGFTGNFNSGGSSSLPTDVENALLAANSPSATNPFATMDDITGGGGGVQSVVAGDNINVDNTDPLNPIVSVPLTKEIIIKLRSNSFAIIKNTSGLTPEFSRNNISTGIDELVSDISLGNFFVFFVNEYTDIDDVIASTIKFDCYKINDTTIEIKKRQLDFNIDFVNSTFTNEFILADAFYNDSIIQIIIP
jgi:hypothetical protein